MFERTIAAVSILCLIACSSVDPAKTVVIPGIAYPFDAGTLERDDVALCFRNVLDRGWNGWTVFERAAFLRIDSQAHFRCDVWPLAFQVRGAEWRGAMPADTVAIVHSHPRAEPDPSAHDRSEAERLGVPVFVVTGSGVTMADANGRVVRFPSRPSR